MSKKKLSKRIKNIKKLSKQIKRDNKKLARATPAQKRVLIAKDVIADLNSKKIKATCGEWMKTRDPLVLGKDVFQDRQLSDILKAVPECNACAIGGMFTASVKRFNKLTCAEFMRIDKHSILADELENSLTHEVDDDMAFQFLGKFFGEYQLDLIESAFEIGLGRNSDNGGYMVDDEDFWDAVRFGMKYKKAKSRMTAIMENIIRNKGVFKPEKLEHHHPMTLDLADKRNQFADKPGVEANERGG